MISVKVPFQVRLFVFLENFITNEIFVNDQITKGNKNPNANFNESACRMYQEQSGTKICIEDASEILAAIAFWCGAPGAIRTRGLRIRRVDL